jgi:hypothetical protein
MLVIASWLVKRKKADAAAARADAPRGPVAQRRNSTARRRTAGAASENLSGTHFEDVAAEEAVDAIKVDD